ncbi:MAG: hypothetical protein JSV22_11790 [Bacteroidales bacterium]|nr:MAG: hypothetical protein JSV22_11790 [Bacteroidales bacterium]
MKTILSLFVIVCIFCACDKTNSDRDQEYEEKESETISISGQKMLVIQSRNGDITITGTDAKDDMSFDITKIVKSRVSVSHAESHMSDISVSIEENTDEIEVIADHPTDNDLDYIVNFSITLPLIFDYEITLGNGNIDMEAKSRFVTIYLGNGNTAADLILLDTCEVDFYTGNGNIDFTIPSETNAHLDASVGNGTVTNSGLSIQNQVSSDKRITGDIGNGAGMIVLVTGNGNIRIESM